jgi:PAS domain S-box-containing protein
MWVLAQLVAVVLAISIEEIAGRLRGAHRITDAIAHLGTAIAIAMLLALPTFIVITRIRSMPIKITFVVGVFVLILRQLLEAFPGVIPLLDAAFAMESFVTGFGVGFILLAIYSAVIELATTRENLRAEENRFGKLIQTAQEAVAILDPQSRLSFVNLKFTEMLGVPAEAILGRHLHEFISTTQLPACLRDQGGQNRDTSAHFECQVRVADGKDLDLLGAATVLLDHQGRSLGAFIMLTDVSALKRAESALRASERNYREIFNATNEAMIILSAEGDILDVNSRTCELFGVDRPKALTSSLGDFDGAVSPALRASGAQWALGVLKDGPQLFEWVIRGKKGQPLWTEVALRTSTLGDRQCIIAAVRDVGERKQLEDQLRQAQKMEAIGQLAGGIAHDFNNLLQVINGYSDISLEEGECDPATREALQQIRRAGESATRLVSQMLAFSRRQVLRKEHLDLNEVIGGLLRMLHRVIGEHIRVGFVPGPHIQAVYADRGQVEQVLMNLAVNARDAMPGGGSLTIETQDVVLDAEYCHANSWAREGHFVLISVGDTGHGMDRHTLSHIWEPFFTTKEVGKGTGLGLATVYGIVRQHDGMVHVYSEPNRGTVFTVYLPAHACAPPANAVPENADLHGTGETILLAEDNEMVCKLTRQMLEQAGYKVITARDGMEAVRLFEDEGAHVDVALLDIVMPGLGGHAVYESVKDRFPNVRFLFSSGYSLGVIQTGPAGTGELDLIQKPFKRVELLSRIRQIIQT